MNRLVSALIFFILITLLFSGIIFAQEIDFEKTAHEIAQKHSDFYDARVEDTLKLSQLNFSDPNLLKQKFIEFSNKNPKEIWYNLGNDLFPIDERKIIPLYKEIAFIGPDGKELVKIVDGESVEDEKLKDVSVPENTEYKSETYFSDALSIEDGKVFIGRVATDYIFFEEVFSGLSEKDVGKYEVVVGRDTMKQGVIRFSTPVYENGVLQGVLVLSADYRALQELSKHFDPTKPLPVLSTTYSGNYLLIYDDQGNTIVHPKPNNIRGYLEDGRLAGFNEPNSTKPGNIFNLYKYTQSPSYQEMAKTTLENQETYVSSATDVGGRTKLTLAAPILFSNNKTNYSNKNVIGGVMMSLEYEEEEEDDDVVTEIQEVEESKGFDLGLFIAISGAVTILILISLGAYAFVFAKVSKLSNRFITIFVLFAVFMYLIVIVVGFISISSAAVDLNSALEEDLITQEKEMLECELEFIKNSIENAYTQNLNLAKSISISSEFDKLLEETIKTGSVQDGHFYPAETSGEWQKLDTLLKEQYDSLQPNVAEIGLYYKNGYIINGVSEGKTLDSAYRGNEHWFLVAFNEVLTPSNSFYVSNIYFSRHLNEPVITYAFPIDFNNERTAVFAVTMRINEMTRLISSQNSYSTRNRIIFVDKEYVNAEGKELDWMVLLADSGKENFILDEREIAKPPFPKVNLSGNKGSFKYDYDGDNFTSIYSKIDVEERELYVSLIEPIEKTNMLIAASQNSVNLARDNLILDFVLIFISTLIPIIFVAAHISRKISKPIEEISRAAEELKKGNFNARAKIMTSDELGELAKTLNTAIATIAETDKKRKELDHAKTEFISITSHELRSPMTPMKAQLQLLEEGHYGKLNNKQLDSLRIVLHNTIRLDKIIVDFLEISRIEAARLKFNFVKTNLVKPIKNVVKEMKQHMPEKNIKIETKIGQIPIIEADPDRIGQVLRNLISNAKKFSPENSKITVEAKVVGEFVQISVKDRGIGISPEDQKRLFEPFYQAEQSMYDRSGGTGLGLTICKGIVESQNGNIWIESEKGKGTIFFFTIPFKPVKDFGSIKLLFSEQKSQEKAIKEIFTSFLGPMAESEFEDFSKTNTFNQKNLYKYVDSLIKDKIITKAEGEKIKDSIDEVFGGKKK